MDTVIHDRLRAAFPDVPEVRSPHSIPHTRIAAVLVPLFRRARSPTSVDADVRVLLTLRSSKLNSHAGEVAFPGGKFDTTDATLIATALREAQEEIGLSPEDVEIMCVLPPRLARNVIAVYPIVGMVKSEFVPSLSPAEVKQVFDVSLKDFLSAERHTATDIDYFGTPCFRVHSFKCNSNVLVTAPGPEQPELVIADLLKSTSLEDDLRVAAIVITAPAPPSPPPSPLPCSPLVKGDIAVGQHAEPDRQREHTVFGLTAAVLIQVASAALALEPEFELAAPGSMYWASPPYVIKQGSDEPPTASKL